MSRTLAKRNHSAPPPLPARSGLPVPGRVLDDLGLYVHIPFCVRKCPYCDFVSGPVTPLLRRRYLKAIEAELRSSPWGGSWISTLFLGGGTPSELTTDQLQEILDTIHDSFDLTRLSEATIECNPGTLDVRKTELFLQNGLNRASLGVQSFHDHHLEALGRVHDAATARHAFQLLRQAGFERCNIDLIFALPNQTLEEWLSDLDEALTLDPGHISLYHLTFEKGTEYERRLQRGILKAPEEGLAAEMFESAIDHLAAAGYSQYEISNFARPGEECRHNQRYWRNLPTLGFGVSAASYVDGCRWANTRQIGAYCEQLVGQERSFDFVETLDPRAALGEEIMLGLRTREGVDLNLLSNKYSIDTGSLFGPTIAELSDQGLVVRKGAGVRLTRFGIMLADSVCMEFL